MVLAADNSSALAIGWCESTVLIILSPCCLEVILCRQSRLLYELIYAQILKDNLNYCQSLLAAMTSTNTTTVIANRLLGIELV